MTRPKKTKPKTKPKKWQGTAAEMLAAKKTLVHKVEICLDSELKTAAIEAETRAKSARRVANEQPSESATKLLTEALTELEEALQTADAATVVFVARALPRTEFEALTSLPDMRPSVGQQDEWKRKCEAESLPYKPLSWNPDTFPPALIAQSLVEPEMTLEQATELWEEWSDAEAGTIFDLCLRTQKMVF